MDKLQQAVARLEQAMVRLEAAAEAKLSDVAALGGIDADTLQIRAVAGHIAARLDSALARIGRVLGEGG